MQRLKNLAINTGLVAASLVVGLLLCEFVVFRFILPASDVPANTFGNDLVRYVPNQTGVWRVENEIAAPYRINAQGWNSGVGDYALARTAGVARVAVVGDSIVEALQVAPDKAMAEQMAGELSRDGKRTEAYRFAMSGAPHSQYLHMVRREVLSYRPDWIVVLLVHNDFDETFQFVPGRYTSSFLKLRVTGDKVEEIPPVPWKAGVTEWVRHTATARFMYYRWRVRLDTIRSLFFSAAHAASERWEANIEGEPLLRLMPPIRLTTDYVFARLAEISQPEGPRVLLAMDGVRAAIYSGRPNPLEALNRMCAELAARHGLAFVDLHAAFSADWAAHHRRFEFESDYHWNEYGHAVAARAIAQEIARLQ
jgi:lysophospholipase L1-like esterase